MTVNQQVLVELEQAMKDAVPEIMVKIQQRQIEAQRYRYPQTRCNICGRFGRVDGLLPCTSFDWRTMMYEHE